MPRGMKIEVRTHINSIRVSPSLPAAQSFSAEALQDGALTSIDRTVGQVFEMPYFITMLLPSEKTITMLLPSEKTLKTVYVRSLLCVQRLGGCRPR